jgi:hypothetical protein
MESRFSRRVAEFAEKTRRKYSGLEKKYIQSRLKKGPVKGGRKWKREELYDR